MCLRIGPGRNLKRRLNCTPQTGDNIYLNTKAAWHICRCHSTTTTQSNSLFLIFMSSQPRDGERERSTLSIITNRIHYYYLIVLSRANWELSEVMTARRRRAQWWRFMARRSHSWLLANHRCVTDPGIVVQSFLLHPLPLPPFSSAHPENHAQPALSRKRIVNSVGWVRGQWQSENYTTDGKGRLNCACQVLFLRLYISSSSFVLCFKNIF